MLGYTREEDHFWFSQNRLGYLYRRDGNAVGYSYLRNCAGPIALLDNADFHTVLAHVEREMTRHIDETYNKFTIPVPMRNSGGLDYVLQHGCRASPFMMHISSDRPLGQYQNYIFMDPPIFTSDQEE